MRQRIALFVAVPSMLLIALGIAIAAPPLEPSRDEAKPSAGGLPPQRDAVRAYVEALRADLSNGKVKTLNEVMRLSDDEARVFWPIYKDYEDELFANGDRRLALIKTYATLTASRSITDENARELAPAWFDIQAQQLELLKKYHGIVQEKISPIRAAQFAQVEHRFALVVDLTIASELPLIESRPR